MEKSYLVESMLLTNEQLTAVGCVVKCSSTIEAAKCAGISRNTLSAWLKLPAFSRAVANAKAEGLQVMKDATAIRIGVVFEFFDSVLLSDEARVSDRIKIGIAILDTALAVNRAEVDRDLKRQYEELRKIVEEVAYNG